MTEITEAEAIEAVSSIAPEAFSTYLLGNDVDPKKYETIMGSTIANDAQIAVQDNSDTLLDIAQDSDLEAMKAKFKEDGSLQDFIFNEYLSDYLDNKDDFDKENKDYLQNEVVKRIHENMEDDGISETLFVKVTNRTYNDAANAIVSDIVDNSDDGIDLKERLDVPLINDYIENYKQSIYETAASIVTDDVEENYHPGDQSILARINGQDVENCMYASGRLSLEDYVQRVLPELAQ